MVSKAKVYLDQHGVQHALSGLHVLLEVAVDKLEDQVQLPLALDAVLHGGNAMTPAYATHVSEVACNERR